MIRLLAILLMLPGAALACACCAEKGERFEYPIIMDEGDVEELAGLRALQPAHLFVTACDLDCVKAIDDPQYKYLVEMAVAEAGVEFDFSDMGGTYRGTLGFDWPEKYTLFGVDTEPNSGGYDPELYVEMRMRGRATGTGDFSDVRLADAQLVFSGRGNLCFHAGLMENWMITVKDEGVDLRLFGALEPE